MALLATSPRKKRKFELIVILFSYQNPKLPNQYIYSQYSKSMYKEYVLETPSTLVWKDLKGNFRLYGKVFATVKTPRVFLAIADQIKQINNSRRID